MLPNFKNTRKNMVDCQIKTFGVSNEHITQAFSKIPREPFFPDAYKSSSYIDDSFKIGNDLLFLNPAVHAKMLEAVLPTPNGLALCISADNGYSAAILSTLVSTVISLSPKNSDSTLAQRAWQDNEISNIVPLQGPANAGAKEHAPFDLIFITGAMPHIPETFLEQLTTGGCLIAIIQKPGAFIGSAIKMLSIGQAGFSSDILFEAESPYLPGVEPSPIFQF